jgi:gamma-glutamyltranspeptidase
VREHQGIDDDVLGNVRGIATEGGRVLLIDRGFLDGADLWYLKATLGIDFVIPAKDNMAVTADARALCRARDPATGIVAQDRGACFTLDPAHANALAPGKRPAHTLMPVMVHRGGELEAVAGTMGGSAQPQINAINLLRCLDLAMAPAEAIAAPRWLLGGMDPETDEPLVNVEATVSSDAVDALRRRGFVINERPDTSSDLGHSHVIRAANGGFTVGSDPRADGSAAAG